MKMLSQQTQNAIEESIEKHLYYHDVPGLVTGVMINGEMVFAKGFGCADQDRQKPMTPETVFHMASISKLFTATAVMQLQEKGIVNIDRPILEYLKDFQPTAPEFSKITIRHMLSHTSGLPDCDDYEWEKARSDDKALHDYVMAQQGIELLHAPEERFFYSNIAYEILGELIQIQTGMCFEDYCKTHIMDPLGMKNSDFRKNRIPEHTLALPHVKDDKKHVSISRIFPYNRAHSPSSTLYSTVVELGYFSRGMMEILKGKREDVLKDFTLKEMMSPQAGIKKGERIGLGWFISDYSDTLFLGHEGNDIGFRTTFALIPEKQRAIFVLANLQTASTRKVMRTIYDLLDQRDELNQE